MKRNIFFTFHLKSNKIKRKNPRSPITLLQVFYVIELIIVVALIRAKRNEKNYLNSEKYAQK